MKFLVDAQLPARLIDVLSVAGFDAVHTSGLAQGNATPDSEIIRIADEESRVVVTKESDFIDSQLLSGRPARLLLISTGNISNREVLALVHRNLTGIANELATSRLVELSRNRLISHE